MYRQNMKRGWQLFYFIRPLTLANGVTVSKRHSISRSAKKITVGKIFFKKVKNVRLCDTSTALCIKYEESLHNVELEYKHSV